MKVTYIGHSGFAVELERAVLVFDYYQGKIPVFSEGKPLFVFVSHRHHDHFAHEVFALARQYECVTFVLSKDCRMSEEDMARMGVPEEARGHILYMGAHEVKCLDAGAALQIETLDSTDEGVAWIVTVDGQCIYHAGDLNWWTWVGEESEEEYQDMTRRYMAELARVQGRKFDVAFVPLDPRQGERYYWGLDAFMRYADAAAVFPMHFWEDYRVFDWIRACPEAVGYVKRLVRITHMGQEFERGEA